MPRYFFNVRDGHNLPDTVGTEFASPEEARAQAVVAAGEAIRDSGAAFWKRGEWEMHVSEEGGAPVCSLRLSASW
jgi:hypothetical protein